MSLNQQPQNAPKRRCVVQSSLPNTGVVYFSTKSLYLSIKYFQIKMSLNQQPQNAPKRRRIVQSTIPNTDVIGFSTESLLYCQFCDYQTNERSNYAKHVQTQHPVVDLTTDVDQQDIPEQHSQIGGSDIATDDHDWEEVEDTSDEDIEENDDTYTQETFDEYPMPSDEYIPDIQHPSYPFKSPQHFLCHAFFNASDSMYSEHDIKKIMSFVRQIVNLTSDNEFSLPSDNQIIDFAKSVRSNIPIFNTTEHEATNANTNQKAKFYMNKPSEYIKHLMANPSKSNQLSRLPDYTPNEGMLLYQAGKWRDHPLFQAPYIQYTSEDGSRKQDFFVGDC